MLAFSLLFFVSCGDSSEDVVINNTQNQQFRYLGANSFNNGQNGTLDFTVFGNGTASGTMQVANDVNKARRQHCWCRGSVDLATAATVACSRDLSSLMSTLGAH